MAEEVSKAAEPRTLCEYFSQWDDFEGTLFIDEFDAAFVGFGWQFNVCLLYTSPSPRD